MLKTIAIAAACLAAGLAQADTRTRWSITEIGKPWSTFAESVNNRGDVSGWMYGPSQIPMHHAFIWNNGAILDLGTPAGWSETDGISINDKGTVVANSNDGKIALWSRGVWTETGVHGSAFDINAWDAITGTYYAGAGLHAFIYRSGVLTDLGTLGGVTSFGRAINERNMVAGFSSLAGNPNMHAFVFDRGTMRDLGTLGGANSWAYDINNFGTVVGGSMDASGKTVAMVWNGGQMRPLLDGTSASFAMSINDLGQVVGTLDNGSFLYSHGKVTRLESIPEVAAAGWTRLSPYSINERGWIAGIGSRDGHAGAFVLVPSRGGGDGGDDD